MSNFAAARSFRSRLGGMLAKGGLCALPDMILLVPAAIDAVKHWKFKAADAVSTVVVMISFQ